MITSAACPAIHPLNPGASGESSSTTKNSATRMKFWAAKLLLRRATAAALRTFPAGRAFSSWSTIQISLLFWIPNRPWGRTASSATIITKAVAVL